MESAHGEDDTKWPSNGLDGTMCISKDCKKIEGGVELVSNEERRAQLQSKVHDSERTSPEIHAFRKLFPRLRT